MLSYLKSRLPLTGRRVYIPLFFLGLTALLTLPSIASIKGQIIEAGSDRTPVLIYQEGKDSGFFIQENTLRPLSPLPEKTTGTGEPSRKMLVYVTGYSSSAWQTDSTPFITAAGTPVRDGVVATNLLPFGTRIRIPEVYGNKIFVVEDRMHPRNSWYVDVWFSNYRQAKTFGVRKTHIEILN